MEKIVECIPNFSEGRDMAVIRQITDQIESVDGVKLLDVDPGASTNRTVVTFVGAPGPVIEAAYLAIKKAGELIDMRSMMQRVVEDHGLAAVVCLGGGGTMKNANRLHKVGIPVVGLPKTIDNDVFPIKMTLGAQSAAEAGADAADADADRTAGGRHGGAHLLGGVSPGGGRLAVAGGPRPGQSPADVCRALRLSGGQAAPGGRRPKCTPAN